MKYLQNRHRIISTINRALHYSIYHTSKSIAKLHEPDFVALLTQYFPQELSSSISNSNFQVSGHFVHQKPIANFQKKNNPELGDLLLILREEISPNHYQFNALLLQAKVIKSKKGQLKVDNHQLKLYQRWPEFHLSRIGTLPPLSFDIYPKSICPGAQFLFIDKVNRYNDFHYYRDCYWYGSPCMYTASPHNPIQLSQCFSEQILDFLNFQTGRPFEVDDTGQNDDWSRLIRTLIKITISSTFNRKNIHFHESPRAFGCNGKPLERNDMFEFLHNKLSCDEILADNLCDQVSPDDSMGISFLFFDKSLDPDKCSSDMNSFMESEYL